MRASLFLFLVLGGAVAAAGWLIEVVRGWQLDRDARRGEDAGHE